jgi:RNA polymerase sigma factor (sigma-70 family)
MPFMRGMFKSSNARYGLAMRRVACSPRRICRATWPSSATMTLDCYFRALQADSQAMQTSMEAPVAPGAESECARCTDGKLGPPEELEHAEVARAIAAAIGTLPEQERAILALYYGRELLMREIGIRFAVSESRICQIHKRGIEHVRAALQILTPRGYVRYRARNSRASC